MEKEKTEAWKTLLQSANVADASRFTFDNYHITNSNEAAFHTARSIVQRNPVGNPVFLWGPAKTGKTHLLKAMTGYLKDQSANTRVKYITGQDFFSEILWDLHHHTDRYLHSYHQEYDLVLIDDLDYIPDSTRMWEEMLSIFLRLADAQKQIVFTSKKSPDELENINEPIREFISRGVFVSTTN